MKENTRTIKWAQAIIIVAILAAILLPQLIGTTSVSTENNGDSVKIGNIYELDGVSMGVVAGSAYEEMTPELYPNSSSTYFNEWADLAIALSQGKIDSFILERSSISEITAEYDDLMQLPGKICDLEYGFAFSETETASNAIVEFNEYIAQIKSDGTLDGMLDYWTSGSTENLKIEPCASDGSRGVLKAVTCLDWTPYNYLSEDGASGLAIDVLYRFCEWAGYELDLTSMDIQSAGAGMTVNKFDVWAYGNYPTTERSESVNFSDGFIPDEIYAVIRKSSYSAPLTDKTLEDMNQPGVKISAIAESEMEYYVRRNYPLADVESYTYLSDVLEACATGKVEYAVTYQDNMPYTEDEYGNQAYISDSLATFDYGLGFSKTEEGSKLCSEYNEYIDSIKASGLYDEYEDKWLAGNADNETLEERSFTGENGPINVNTPGDWAGYVFFTGSGDISGFLPELLNGFCEEYGYTPSYAILPRSSGIAGLNQGKYDIILDSIAITEENEDSIIISDTFLSSPAIVMTNHIIDNVTDTEQVSKASVFWDDLKDSFEKNFIREDRWKLILSGLKVTVLMSIASAVIGTLLGILICLLRQSRNPFLTGFARIYIKVMQGMPIVVLLMILYYIVFGQVDIGAFWVSVAGFSLDFAAYVSEIFRSGIEAVPSGQLRAALALGFNKSRAFRKVVLPQAMRGILPVYRGQFVSMVKLTSVAGYISVEDLTKVSDMIRARTYDAFFPLITTAILYFLIAALLVSLLKLIEVRTDPMVRNRIPGGIKLDESLEKSSVTENAGQTDNKEPGEMAAAENIQSTGDEEYSKNSDR